MTFSDQSKRHGDGTGDLWDLGNCLQELGEKQQEANSRWITMGAGRAQCGWGVGILSRPCGTVVILSLAKLGSLRVSRWQVAYSKVLVALAGKCTKGAKDVSKGSTEWLEAKSSVVYMPVPGSMGLHQSCHWPCYIEFLEILCLAKGDTYCIKG